jgi:hypothetical protein
MKDEFVALSKKEADVIVQWQHFRAVVNTQESEVAISQARIVLAAYYRSIVRRTVADTKTKNRGYYSSRRKKALVLNWVALQELKALRQLRYLPKALRYARWQVGKKLADLQTEKP